MGNRAVITTERNLLNNSGLGVYVHWNGGRDSVQGFLEYCRLRSFRTPETDDYGWARLCQVIGNFLGADGCSLGIDEIGRLDTNNGDNGTYLIEDWKIVGRRFFDNEEQSRYPLHEVLHIIDGCQPEAHQLGKEMIDCLLYHDRTISDVCWNYQHEMVRRSEEGRVVGGFHVGRFYAVNSNGPKSYAKVVDRTRMDLVLEIDGEERRCPKFRWKDGSESTIVEDGSGRTIALDSSKEVIA